MMDKIEQSEDKFEQIVRANLREKLRKKLGKEKTLTRFELLKILDDRFE